MDITVKDQNGIKKIDKFYIDEPCVISFFVGELGWLAQRWQAYLRHLKFDVYKDHKFFIMLNGQYHVLVKDFVNWTIDLPDEFYNLRLETDCYEAPVPNSPPSSLTPPNVWYRLIEYIRQFYNVDKAVEIWTPRGCNTWIDMQPQLFTTYTTEALIKSKRPVITIFPRGRSRASFRNVPEYVWYEVVEKLRKSFDIALCGTPSGSYLVNYQADHVENFIGKADLDKVIYLLNNSICSISSQSGPTHVSLLSMCPSYIIGHEQERHTKTENRTNTPTSFKFVNDYRSIDSDTIVRDVYEFIDSLSQKGWGDSRVRRASKQITGALIEKNKKNLVGAIVGYNDIANIGNMVNLLDIEKLYLIGEKVDADKIENLQFALQQYGNYDKVQFIAETPENAISFIEEKLDFVYMDKILEKNICEDYFFLLKSGGFFGSNSMTEWQKVGFPLPYRRACQSLNENDNSGWFVKKGGELRKSFKGLIEKNNLVGAEIGVYFGENSFSLLENLNIEKLYLIDPYNQGLVGIHEETAPEYILKNAKRLLDPYKDKIEWVRELSENAAKNIPDELDFVCVDGDHTYEGAKKDLGLYWPKIKDGGLLIGHDYDNQHVARAVQEFFDSKEEDYLLFTDYDPEGTLEFWVYKVDNFYNSVIGDGIDSFHSIIQKRLKNE